jgi:predicted phage tail protein
MYTAITLHGALADNATKANWLLSVNSVGEALRAIEMNCRRKGKSIFKYLYEHEGGQAEYRVVIDGKDFESIDELALIQKHYKTIDIIPVPRGSGNAGLWEVIIGVVLIVVGIALTIPTGGSSNVLTYYGFSAVIAGSIISALILNGIALVIGGVVQLLNPPQAAEVTKNKPSYLFGGVVNSTDQGGPVPEGYGQLIVGSQVISSFITTVPFGTIVENSGELQTNTGSAPNPIDGNVNIDSLIGNIRPVPVNPLNP